jgi:hypothetical protein
MVSAFTFARNTLAPEKAFIEGKAAYNLEFEGSDLRHGWIQKAIHRGRRNDRRHEQASFAGCQPLIPYLLGRRKVVLPSFGESVSRKTLDQSIRDLYREKLVGIREEVSFTDVHQNLEKTKSRMVREVYDTPARLTCVPASVCQFAALSRQVRMIADSIENQT